MDIQQLTDKLAELRDVSMQQVQRDGRVCFARQEQRWSTTELSDMVVTLKRETEKCIARLKEIEPKWIETKGTSRAGNATLGR